MAVVAGCAGAIIAGIGILGILDPAYFMGMVGAFQSPTLIYAAAAIRLLLGLALILTAGASRWPSFLRLLGGIIFIAGLVTPFGGAWLGRTLLDLWPSWGAGIVQGWGAIAFVLGGLVVYSTVARRKGVPESPP